MTKLNNFVLHVRTYIHRCPINENDVTEAREYLDCLPRNLRIRLGGEISELLCVAYRYANTDEKYEKVAAIWRVACFLPNTKDMRVAVCSSRRGDTGSKILGHLLSRFTIELRTYCFTAEHFKTNNSVIFTVPKKGMRKSSSIRTAGCDTMLQPRSTRTSSQYSWSNKSS